MTKTPLSLPRQGEPWQRTQLIELLGVAAAVKEYSFIRKSALGWLAVFPGDLPVQLIHAQAVSKSLKTGQAVSLLEDICQTDPVYAEAQQARFEMAAERGMDERMIGELYALAPNQRIFRTQAIKDSIPSWAKSLAEIRSKLKQEDPRTAGEFLPALLGSDSGSALAAVTHLELLSRDSDTPDLALRQLAEHYQSKFPEALLPSLILADSLIKGGQSDKGVALIHKAVSRDITGQVACRLWGEDHVYKNLWPSDLQAVLDIRLPAAVSGALGWNQLPAGIPDRSDNGKDYYSYSETVESKDISVPERLIEIEDDLHFRDGGKTSRSTGKFPMYVVFSTRKGLEKKYGPETAAIIIEEMKKTTYAVRLKPGWGALMLLADDPSSMANYGLKPTLSDDPWALKLALIDLEGVINDKGLMIGAVLIVGGPDVVPYHKLPNPIADVDSEVPSDNPYGTLDENYFIPEWPVGRLPGGVGSDPGLLLDMLRHISEHHMGKADRRRSLWEIILEWLSNLFAGAVRHNHSFGYVAEAWKSASEDVFKLIQERGDLVTSPPYGKDTEIPVPITRYGYFNLHGVEDSPYWYGQKDLTKGQPGPDYPVALRPQDINAYDDAPLFVFTEACYGVHLKGREIEESIALKYLSRGSHAVVGSTVTAYGSVSAPLIAADLLAAYFWKHINQGFTSGIALQKAKIQLAREMNTRQGYLDGEDQKTLISFLHFGDPLASPATAERRESKSPAEPRHIPAEVKTVCDRSNLTTDIPSATLMHVKQVVKRYLPGMEDAEMVLSTERKELNRKGNQLESAQLGGKPVHTENLGQRHVVTLSKKLEIPQNGGKTVHRHYARVTFDKTGKMVKLAVSR
jgi:hypothetical protein